MTHIPPGQTPAAISYGSFNFSFQNDYPLPKVSWGLNRNRTQGGDLLSEQIDLTLDGVVAVSGGVQPDTPGGSINALDTLIARANNLKDEIYDNTGKYFTFSFAGVTVVSGYATVKNLTFSENENYWNNYINYNLELSIPVTGTGSYLVDPDASHFNITSCEDTYGLQETEEKYEYPSYNSNKYYSLYKLTRNISATAKSAVKPGSGSLAYATQWVNKREIEHSIDNFFPSNTFRLFNRNRSVDFDESAGTYSIKDEFLVKSGEPWIYKNTISAGYEGNFLRKISVDGEIQGLEPATGIYRTQTTHSGVNQISGFPPLEDYTKDDFSDVRTNMYSLKYQNAISGYLELVDNNIFFNKALAYDQLSQNLITDDFNEGNFGDYSSKPLHGIPVSIVEGLDPHNGKVTFSRTYDSRPTGLLKGTLSESLQLSDSKPKSLIREIPVIGRRLGPLYYNVKGYTTWPTTFASGVGSRTVTYEAFFPRPTGLNGYKFPIEEINKVDSYLKLYAPPNYTSFITEDNQDLDLTNNKLTKTITWEYIECNPQ